MSASSIYIFHKRKVRGDLPTKTKARRWSLKHLRCVPVRTTMEPGTLGPPLNKSKGKLTDKGVIESMRDKDAGRLYHVTMEGGTRLRSGRHLRPNGAQRETGHLNSVVSSQHEICTDPSYAWKVLHEWKKEER